MAPLRSVGRSYVVSGDTQTVSRENVDAVRKSVQGYVRGDYEGASAYLADDVTWELGQERPARGPEEVRRAWARWDAEWEELETTAEEVIDAGDSVVLAVRYRGRGPGSGIEIDECRFELHTFRDGKCVRKADFRTREEAIAAAGAAGGSA